MSDAVLAGDGFFLNFVAVMQMLVSKVHLDKVDPMYLHLVKSKIVQRDETRYQQYDARSKIQLSTPFYC